MGNRRETPEVNAGTMADIAFLLLIFFLVTTVIETDVGLDRMLPRMDDSPPEVFNERNILEVGINADGELLVEGSPMAISNLRDTAIAFLDNGGAKSSDDHYCDYCKGKRSPESSDGPKKAIVSLTNHRQTNYGTYIAVQNELVAAYNTLRNREARRLYGTDFTFLQSQYTNPRTAVQTKLSLKEKIRKVHDLFPMYLSEAEIR